MTDLSINITKNSTLRLGKIICQFMSVYIVLDRWLYHLRFYTLFNSISVISGLWEGDNERLSAIKPCLRLKRFPLPAGLEPGTV